MIQLDSRIRGNDGSEVNQTFLNCQKRHNAQLLSAYSSRCAKTAAFFCHPKAFFLGTPSGDAAAQAEISLTMKVKFTL